MVLGQKDQTFWTFTIAEKVKNIVSKVGFITWKRQIIIGGNYIYKSEKPSDLAKNTFLSTSRITEIFLSTVIKLFYKNKHHCRTKCDICYICNLTSKPPFSRFSIRLNRLFSTMIHHTFFAKIHLLIAVYQFTHISSINLLAKPWCYHRQKSNTRIKSIPEMGILKKI